MCKFLYHFFRAVEKSFQLNLKQKIQANFLNANDWNFHNSMLKFKNVYLEINPREFISRLQQNWDEKISNRYSNRWEVLKIFSKASQI